MFSEELEKFDFSFYESQVHNSTSQNVLQVLRKSSHHLDDLPVLLSTEAANHIEAMSSLAMQIRKRKFGNIVGLYIPLYLSNHCSNACAYCGFRAHNKTGRVTLTVEEVVHESETIHQMGFRNILLVAGETKKIRESEYLTEIIRRLSARFTTVAVEIEPLEQTEYATLRKANLDGVTLYQETYHPSTYSEVHPSGTKTNYKRRLDIMDRVGAAGIRKIGIGALCGLYDFRWEALRLGLHCRYLLRQYWQSAIAVSFPRLRESETGFRAPFPVSDRDLIQMVLSFRIIFPDVDLVLSTRERPALRDALAQVAVTYMSAGSRTSPGAYGLEAKTAAQFDLEDTRTVPEIYTSLLERGLDPVWKDWNAPTG